MTTSRERARQHYADIKAAGTFRCEPCDQNFARGRDLERHKNSRKHAEKTNETYNIWCYLIYWDEEKFPNDRYVGSSTNVGTRISFHRHDITKNRGLSEAVNRMGDEWKYRILGFHIVEKDEKRRQWEQKYIDEHDTLAPNGLNKYRAYNSPEQALEQRRESVKNWQSNNKEYMKAYDKERDQRPERGQYNREYREKNKQKQKEYMKEYHGQHKGVKKQDRPKKL